MTAWQKGDIMGGRGGFSKIQPTIKINMQFFGRKQIPLYLPKKEYGKIIHEINTLYSSKYNGKTEFFHYSGDYKYKIYSNGYNNYKVGYKLKIK